MKKYLSLIFILTIALCTFSCKSDSDALATYKGGEITRAEFYDWLKAKRLFRESLLKSKKKQESKLEKMFIELISVEKAKEQGIDKSEEFSSRIDLVTEGQLIKRLYEKEVSEKVEFNEPAVKLKQILIGIKRSRPPVGKKGVEEKPSAADEEKQTNDAMAKAREVIEKLDKGEAFEELAKKYSDHHSRMRGGDIGFAIRSMLPVEVANIAFSLDEGEYSKEPIKTSRGVFVIKVEEKEELDEDNIGDIIENDTQARMIMNRMQGSYSRDYLNKLMEADDVEKNFDNVTKKSKDAVIFKIGDKSYTNADLEKRIEMRFSRYRGDREMPEINDERKKSLAMNYFRYELLKRDAYNKGIDKDPEYVSRMEMTVNNLLANEFMKNSFQENVGVTDKEIKEEYDKNKDRKYYKMVKKGNKRVKEVEPFSKVKERIESTLKRKKGATEREKWKKDVMKDYEFKVDLSELEGE